MRVDALVCSQPGSLHLVQVAAPERGPDAALVRPRRVGICGTDYHIFEGKHPYLEYPRVMGHELAVEAIEGPAGSGVTPGEIYVVNPYLSCGQCVACRAGKPNCCVSISVLGVHRNGGMAELLSLPVANLVRADGLTVDECATVEFLSIGAHAVRRGAVADGDNVLVVGAGPIGLGVAIFARQAGAKVVVLDRDSARAATAQAIAGISALTATDNPRESVEAATNGEGFAVVFDATGTPGAMQSGFEFVAHGGRYVFVSVVKDAITFSDPDFHRKEMTLYASRNATTEDFRRVIAAIRARHVAVDRLITHRTTLRDAARNIPIWAVQKTGLIKALVEIA
jgi:2-desacetyl-2-hydroxyethyl bacteriochlorophyllide A dehydrogenase